MTRDEAITTLRAMADWLEARPTIGDYYTIMAHLHTGTAEEFRSAIRSAGGAREKYVSGESLWVNTRVGSGEFTIFAPSRAAVCTKRIRYETVRVVKPDPVLAAALPTIELEETRVIEEWDCPDSFLDPVKEAKGDDSDRVLAAGDADEAEREAIREDVRQVRGQ